MISRKLWMVLAVAVLLLAACGPAERALTVGEPLESFDFSAPGTFEEGSYGDVALIIADGVYYIDIQAGAGILWGQGGSPHTDVVIEAQMQAETTDNETLYGIMCRADESNNGDGYFFAISPGGSYGILRGEGDSYISVASGNSSAIISGTNDMRVVCVGEYLALYVNETFVTAAQDDTYASGLPGLAAGGGVITASFDNLQVMAASVE